MAYYGWRIAWSLAITQTVGFGVLYYAFGVFTLPMEAEFGWTRAQTSGALSLGLLLSGLLAFPLGRWVDRHGARLPMSLGSAVAALLVLAWSFIGDLRGLYLVQAGIGLAMATVLYDVAFTVIARWFRRNRIRAMMIVTSVAGLASTIFIPLATVLVELVGWRDALRLLALLLGAITIPLHALVLRDRPGRVGQELDHESSESDIDEASSTAGQAFRSPLFWRLTGGFSLDRIVMVAVAAHAVPLLLERGYAVALVAAATGSIGLMQVAGRLLFAPASRYLSLSQLTALTFAGRVAALLVLLIPQFGAYGVWLFAGLFGLSNGATTLARAGLVGEAFGSGNYGAINGGMATFVAVAQTVAPLSVGAMRVHFDGYEVALLILIGLAALSVMAVVGVRSALSGGPYRADDVR